MPLANPKACLCIPSVNNDGISSCLILLRKKKDINEEENEEKAIAFIIFLAFTS